MRGCFFISDSFQTMKDGKQQLRQQCLARRKALSYEQKKNFSNKILQTLHDYLHQQYEQGIQVLCYRSLAEEVDTSALFTLQRNHQYYAPVTRRNGDMHWLKCDSDTEWQAGVLRVLEPVNGQCWQEGESPAIVLCPVVGFDSQGNRIGMGKGCFDRWLAQHKQHIDRVIGLAFDCQRCSGIEPEAHDIPLDVMITEQGWMKCPNT
ncbi:MAG: 5-formyltetrahydrofolate cyclo-ligase [Mariprofundaceae bacterium]|nr:5-formyltetrahydrofolate cyclo-ligase [Mariprofundaceae bacterium]